MKKYILAFAATLLLLTGCASSVTKDIKVTTETDPKANYSGYKSFKWLGSASIIYDPLGKWEPPQFDADAEIKFHITNELRNRGMVEDSVDPDLLVTFAAGIDMENMDLEISEDSDLKETLTNVPVGALTIVMVDARTSVVIWTGIATAEIQQSPDQEVIKKRLEYAVTTMFKQLPK
jgi:hypothetical protein